MVGRIGHVDEDEGGSTAQNNIGDEGWNDKDMDGGKVHEEVKDKVSGR